MLVVPRSSTVAVLLLLLYSSTVVPVVQAIDHGKALTEWLLQQGGSFHKFLEIRPFSNETDTPYYSLVATQRIPQDETLLKIPRPLLITPQREYEIGDRVQHLYDKDEEMYPAYVSAIYTNNGQTTYQIVDDDGDRQDDATDDDMEPMSYMCKSVQTLMKHLKLGQDSPVKPYMDYLQQQPRGQLPSAWSKPGQYVLQEVLHDLGEKEGQLLPPHDPFFHLPDFDEDCRVFVNTTDYHQAQHMYLLLLQRGWDDLMIPVFDLMSHGNGHWLNTKIVGSVHDPELPVTVQASRDIQEGEEIYTTYNFCEDCEMRKLWYGTPELLRDYGFVEQFPQRWVFEDQEVIFDLEQDNNGDDENPSLTLTFVEGRVLESDQAPFFVEQLKRLEGLEETVFAQRDTDIPDHEWDTLVKFHQAYLVALRTLLDNSKDATSLCNEESCDISSSRYFGFFYDREGEEYWQDDRPKTCDDYRSFGVGFWEFTEFIESPYQMIKFLQNPTFDPPDTCFMLEATWQICTSYRPHYHEMAVHYPARFLKEVKRVVFVGGGDSMLLHDILKYPTLEKVVGLEIDQQVVRSSYRYFGTQPHFDNDKVEWWFGDAAKSLLMIPKEYFGTFDLVLVDLSETVAALSVTDDLDIMETLTLLVKPDGILVKNEYMYFPHQRKLFRDALHIHYYNTPVVCSQSLILSSNNIDFVRGDFHDHDGVDPLMKLLDDPDVKYSVSKDYQRNNTNPHTLCSSDKSDPTIQKHSPGVTMIAEAEQTTVEIQSTDAVKTLVEKAVTEQGLSVIKTIQFTEVPTRPVTVTILKEGYVVARAWPEQNYCAFDVHLWGSFEKDIDAKNALIAAVGSPESGSSAFRIVSGGMFGISKWQEDAANQGPKLDPCEDKSSTSAEATSTARELAKNATNTTRYVLPNSVALLTAVEESMGIVPEEDGDFVVAVICGKNGTICHAVDTVKKYSRVTDVIPVYSCDSLIPGVEFLEDAVARMLDCEKTVWKYLDEAGFAKQKRIRAIVLDSSAERPFTSVFQSFCKSHLNRNRFFADRMVVVAPVARLLQKWRSSFVNSFREKIYPKEPTFKSDVAFNSTVATSADDSSPPPFIMSIASSGDPLFLKHLSKFADQVETKLSDSVVAEIDNVRGGDFLFQDPFEYKEIFSDADFDQTSAIQQWESQKSLGLQVVLQMNQNELLSLDWDRIRNAIDASLTRVLPKNEKISVEMVTKAMIGGDGGVVVTSWSNGHAIVLWDGRLHIDVNLFLYEEDFDFVTELEKELTKEVQGLTRSLRDMHPRGTGRVMNFAKDIEGMAVKPTWIK